MQQADETDQRDELRIGTYNLYLGADLSLLLGERSPEQLETHQREVRRQLEATAFPNRVEAVARLLAGRRLDLVGLQEVCEWRVDGAPLWHFAELLVETLASLGEPYDVVVSQPTFTGAGALALDEGQVELRLTGSNVLLRRRRSAVTVLGTGVGMFRNALSLPALGEVGFVIERGWCSARCVLPGGGELTVVTTHTEAHDSGSRQRQRDELLLALPPDGTPTVVVGDFNAEPGTVGMPADFVDAWVAAGHPSDAPEGATCCQAPDLANEHSTLDHRIDYVWSRGLPVLACERFGGDPDDRTATGCWPSDHAGVAATLAAPTGR